MTRPLALGAAVGGIWIALIGVVAAAALSLAATGQQPSFGFAPSAAALADIPAVYLDLYEEAGARYRLDWTVLAGIGKVECDHGRDPSPSCTQHGAYNYAGAGGPMQFEPATFARYGVSVDGGAPDMWDPGDAIYSAANYLRASGAPGNWRTAIFAYNHSASYVQEVLAYAASYRGAAEAQTASLVPGAAAQITASGLALAPAGAPTAVQALIAAGDEIDTRPYPEPDVHYGSLAVLWPAYDCSGATSYVLYRAGLASVEPEVSGELESFGDPGPAAGSRSMRTRSTSSSRSPASS